MSFDQEITSLTNSSKCAGCGAPLHFEPGTQTLTCDYCGSASKIDGADIQDQAVMAEDYGLFLSRIGTEKTAKGFETVKCSNCGSTSVLESKVSADKCPFCRSPLVVDLAASNNYIAPHYVLPFKVNQQTARKLFLNWIKDLKFAPSDLKSKVNNSTSPIDGVYLPYFIFDADSVTKYTGERGMYYYISEIYYERVNGDDVMRTREVRHTNWFPVSGTVENTFTNMVRPASNLVDEETLKQLGNFELNALVRYDERYVTGFKAQTFSIDPKDAIQGVADSIGPFIAQSIFADIGGNEQRITSRSTDLTHIKIKYVLMPLWISAYRYKDKTYQFAINGCTGKVSGQHPVGTWKIVRLVLIILAVIAALVIYFMVYGNSASSQY
ncbi:MAG TPA: hypothetical protein VHA56_04460 [Mucilaginibacter sp.]|nr:hypothetical protein [Mucilaginibacter sp.]